jgi:hypothetical protein
MTTSNVTYINTENLDMSQVESGVEMFRNCSKLTNSIKDFNLINMTNFEGAFYNTYFVTEYSIPEGTTSVGANAFGKQNGTDEVLGGALGGIGGALGGLVKPASYPKIETVYIPASVTEIGARAFENCKSLKTINFGGTEEQWNAITFGEYWNDNTHSDLVINFNYIPN